VNRHKMKNDLLDHVGPEYGQWIESLMGEPLPPPGITNLFETLKTGVVLCKVANAVKPGVIPSAKIKNPVSAFVAAENVQEFIRACKLIGIKDAVRTSFWRRRRILPAIILARIGDLAHRMKIEFTIRR